MKKITIIFCLLKSQNNKIGIKSLLTFMLLLSILGNLCFAQTYINGNLSTGATAKNGTVAPVPRTWSELQNNAGDITVANQLLGINGSITNGFTIADNFIVPAGQTWNISKFTFYGYQTNYTGFISPFAFVRLRIHDNNPMVGSTNIVFGDLITNRFRSSSTTNTYRIGNTLVPPSPTNTARNIWAIEANAVVSLGPGTYWVEYQTDVTEGVTHFLPTSAILNARTQPGYNAIQKTVSSGIWASIMDVGINQSGTTAGQPVAMDMPFRIDYTTCSGIPSPGNTLSTASMVCPGVIFTLSAENTPVGTGITYQWQSSLNGTTFNNIVGATSATFNASQTTATWYRVRVSCIANNATTTAIQVNMFTGTCYCAAGAINGGFERISKVVFNTINNSSTSIAGYEDFTTINTTVTPGNTYPIAVTIINQFSSDQVIVWIDYNQNGLLTDLGEKVILTNLFNPKTGNITIPASALTGPTRMRIRLHDTFSGSNATPCGNSSFGQVEDYTVIISGCVPPVLTASITNVSCFNGNNGSIDLTITGGSSTPLITWSNNETSEDISNLSAGDYTVTVSDGNGCSATATYTVTEPSALVVSAMHTPILCNGGSASVNVSATGGTAPYTGTGIFNQSAGTVLYPVSDANGCLSNITVTVEEPAALNCSITVSPFITVPNHNPHTIYRGYGPQSVTLTGTGSGGTGGLTYSWGTAGSGSSISISPTSTTTYILTVTDANGCSVTCSILINVIDVRCGNNLAKVLVCHRDFGNPEENTICIAYQAVAAHLAHGDLLGSCESPLTLKASPIQVNDQKPFAVKVHSNPTTHHFTLQILTDATEKVTIRVFDFYGREIETRTIISLQNLQIGSNYSQGIYYAEITQGKEKQIVKLIKMK